MNKFRLSLAILFLAGFATLIGCRVSSEYLRPQAMLDRVVAKLESSSIQTQREGVRDLAKLLILVNTHARHATPSRTKYVALINDGVVDTLAKVCASTDLPLRREATEVFFSLKLSDAAKFTPVLLSAAKDDDRLIRLSAAKGLTTIANNENLPTPEQQAIGEIALRLCDDADPDVRITALHGFCNLFNHVDQLDLILQACGHTSLHVQRAGCNALIFATEDNRSWRDEEVSPWAAEHKQKALQILSGLTKNQEDAELANLAVAAALFVDRASMSTSRLMELIRAAPTTPKSPADGVRLFDATEAIRACRQRSVSNVQLSQLQQVFEQLKSQNVDQWERLVIGMHEGRGPFQSRSFSLRSRLIRHQAENMPQIYSDHRRYLISDVLYELNRTIQSADERPPHPEEIEPSEPSASNKAP